MKIKKLKQQIYTQHTKDGIAGSAPGLFGTYDLGCAAALVTLGYQVFELDKQDPKKIRFMFGRSPQLANAVESYWLNELPVDALSMFESMKKLKNRIYSE